MRLRVVTMGYSGTVVLLARQVVIAATVLALSGSQAVLSACLALCFASTPAAAGTHHQSAEAESVNVVAAAEHDGHHASPAAPESSEAAALLANHGSAPILKALCGSCCPDSDVTRVAGPRAERADADRAGSRADHAVVATAREHRSHGPIIGPTGVAPAPSRCLDPASDLIVLPRRTPAPVPVPVQ